MKTRTTCGKVMDMVNAYGLDKLKPVLSDFPKLVRREPPPAVLLP